MEAPKLDCTAGPSIDVQQQYYTNRWREFNYAHRLELIRVAKVLDYMSRIELPRGPQICDLGCGSGWSTNVLSTFGAATGVDLSDLSTTRERHPNCHFITANILEWDAPESKFDAVISMEVLEHLENADQGRYIAVTRRILKPGGYLILTTPNKTTMNAIAGGGLTWTNQPIENWLDPRQLRALLARHGFAVKERTSVVLGVAHLRTYRIVNSFKLNRALDVIGLGKAWRRTACWANYGVHLVVLAKKN
jgi:2-polyprenyl-3-methyl-5-hydroxy-6-metoxy-1,4-benzoquinol methylase